MELPGALQQALEAELHHAAPKKLARTTSELSLRYRKDPSDGRTLIRNAADVRAYAAFRMPATFAAAYMVLEAVRTALPQWAPQTLLDVGAGPGTVMWAAAAVGWSFDSITLLEREAAMIDLGRRLAQKGEESIRAARWIKTDLSRDGHVSGHDLVTAAYVLGELNENTRQAVLERLWRNTRGVLAVIEPGTPRGFERIKQMRQRLIEQGAVILAPCPHDRPCPMEEGDWCHFAARVSRTRLHRLVKSGELACEDEKFAYLAASRLPGGRANARVLRRPQVRKGHLVFTICTAEGIGTRIAAKSDKEAYRQARKLKWGSSF